MYCPLRSKGQAETGEQVCPKTIGVCASGPSLKKEDCETLKENCEEIIAVNDSYRLVDAHHLYAADRNWWSFHIPDVARDFNGKCWSCETPANSNWGGKDFEEWGITILHCPWDNKGLSRQPGVVHSGKNSGYQAINLAYLLGATRIILLGFDMHNHGGKQHFFGNHPPEISSPNLKPDRFIAAFRTIKPQDYGIEIINCSRETALDAFPRHRLEDVCRK